MQAPISTSSIVKRDSQFYPSIYPIPYHYGSADASKGRGKFLLDTVLAIVALLFLLPLFVGFSIAIKLDSIGPIFYRHRVLGRNGRIFYAYSFRTTFYGNGRQAKTSVGKFLIRMRLTELPLLFNVLKNEMSFVGPRIVSPEQIVKYGPMADRLLTVSPGITGYWQLKGHQADKRIEQDMYYIDNHSTRGDLSILLNTVTAVIKK